MSRSYKHTDVKLLWYRAGGRCAICKQELSLRDKDVLIGNMAHIVALKPGGTRGDAAFPTRDINAYENLILLCPTDHEVIDKPNSEWSTTRLHDLKSEHESWVRNALSWAENPTPRTASRNLFVLAGPSGVGKDVIVNRLLRSLEANGHASTFLRRFTTRGQRPEEVQGHPYTYLTHEEFESKMRSGLISCIHTSFGNTYGCDSHFGHDAPPGSCVLHTMRNLNFLPDMKDRAEASGLRVYNLLITADEATLNDRILQRTASAEEKATRIATTREDLSWLARNEMTVAEFFDLRIKNSDDKALRTTVGVVYSFILAKLGRGEKPNHAMQLAPLPADAEDGAAEA